MFQHVAILDLWHTTSHQENGMSITNTTRIMEAVRHHFKLTLGSCGCSICMEIKRPDTCPDLDELLSYNRSVPKKPVETKKNVPVSTSERPYTPPRPPDAAPADEYPMYTCGRPAVNGQCSSCERAAVSSDRTSRAGSEFWQ